MYVEGSYKQSLKEHLNNKFKRNRKALLFKLLSNNDKAILDLIVAENKVEELILSLLKEIYPTYINAKDISFLLSAGKNIAYEEEYILICIKVSKARKKFLTKSLLPLIRIRNCHEVVLKNLIYLIENKKRKIF